MMFDHVITFGDSWPAGAELHDDEYPFGKLMAQSLGSEFSNFAQPGTSIDHMVLQLQTAIQSVQHTNSLAIFFLTEYSRTICFDNNGLQLNPRKTDYEENYVRYLYNDHLGHFRANVALLALQSMCRAAGLTDYYVFGWTKFPINLTGINTNKIFDHGKTTCLDMFKVYDNDPTHDPNFIFYDYNHYIKPKICHPNQIGHQKIADELLKWVNNTPNS